MSSYEPGDHRLGPGEGHQGWANAERRAPHLWIWTEAFKRNGRWELEEDGRRDIVMYVSEKAAADLEQPLLTDGGRDS